MGAERVDQMETWAINLICVLIGFVGFGGTFLISMRILPKYSASFAALDVSKQGESASRVHSSLHGIVVPIGVFICLTECELWPWDSDVETAFRENECDSIQGIFGLVIGYFASDLIITLYYRYELWQVFVVHHVVGMAPYIVTCFICSNLPFLLGGGICVELANPWMNLEAHLDLIGYHDSTAYGVVKHISWWNWVVWRVSFPTFLFFGMVVYVIPHYGGEGCYIMSYITGTLIFLFCCAVFFLVVTPGLLKYHKCIGQGVKDEQPVTDGELSVSQSVMHAIERIGTGTKKGITPREHLVSGIDKLKRQLSVVKMMSKKASASPASQGDAQIAVEAPEAKHETKHGDDATNIL